MKRFSWTVAFIVSAAFLLGTARFATAADDKPASGGAAKSEKSAKPKSMRLSRPWRDMTSLTDEQKAQLAEIQRKANEEAKQVRDRAREASMAILNESQKAELTGLEEKLAAERKTRNRNGAAAGQTDVEKKAPEKQ